jgi:UDP:flavonoid glycosyltransferase YjiC (YdhE family)
MEGYFARCIAKLEAALRAEGATEFKRAIPYQTLAYTFDMTIQLCSQSLEFAYTDLQPRTKFVGLLQPKALPADSQYPGWWKEVTNGDKKIIMVSQGTVAMNYKDLIMPTITALADRDDLLVIALLGTPGATLPKDFTIPANTRVIDYLNYDALLPYVSVFVMNAGYGGFLHGAVHGVPMVLSGESEDKKDVAARGEYTGIAVNLRTGKPTPNQVRAGVERVLGDDSFKKRVMAIMMENRELDVLGAVEKELMALAGADMYSRAVHI